MIENSIITQMAFMLLLILLVDLIKQNAVPSLDFHSVNLFFSCSFISHWICTSYMFDISCIFLGLVSSRKI